MCACTSSQSSSPSPSPSLLFPVPCCCSCPYCLNIHKHTPSICLCLAIDFQHVTHSLLLSFSLCLRSHCVDHWSCLCLVKSMRPLFSFFSKTSVFLSLSSVLASSNNNNLLLFHCSQCETHSAVHLLDIKMDIKIGTWWFTKNCRELINSVFLYILVKVQWSQILIWNVKNYLLFLKTY